MTPSEIHDLKDEKMMKICDFNKKIFSHGEEVKIFIEMKKIQKLEVKIFEILTENYYLNFKKSFYDNMDLDGMIPNE